DLRQYAGRASNVLLSKKGARSNVLSSLQGTSLPVRPRRCRHLDEGLSSNRRPTAAKNGIPACEDARNASVEAAPKKNGGASLAKPLTPQPNQPLATARSLAPWSAMRGQFGNEYGCAHSTDARAAVRLVSAPHRCELSFSRRNERVGIGHHHPHQRL